MVLIGKIFIGLALLGVFIVLLLASSSVRNYTLNFLKNSWVLGVILLILAIFFNDYFLLVYRNTAKIGLFILCLGIIGIGTSSGRKLIMPGAFITIIGYFVLQTPLY